MYRYDWLENLFGLNVHTIDRIAPEYQDSRDFRPVLLREADFLDFLGIIGLVREYGRGPKGRAARLPGCAETAGIDTGPVYFAQRPVNGPNPAGAAGAMPGMAARRKY